MVRHAVRALVCAGMLAAGLAMSGAGGFVAVAEPGDAGSDGAEGPTVDSKTETGSESSGGNDRTPGDRPTSTVGSGREDTAAGGAPKKQTSEPGSPKPRPSVRRRPPILSVPIIGAPVRPVTPAGAIGTSAGHPAQGVAVDVVAVGVRTPQLTGSLPQTVQTAPTGSLAPMRGRATRLGDPRLLRNPTAGELAAVALPGVAGLLCLTFGGGVIGYRQASSVRFVRSTAAERFLR